MERTSITVQEILVAMLKFKHFNILKNNLTEKEISFIEDLKKFRARHHSRNLRVKDTFDGRSVLIWESFIGKTIACPITEDGFHFSDIESFKEKEKEMDGKIRLNDDPYREDDTHLEGQEYNNNLLKKEIKEIKMLIETHLVKAETCSN